MVFKFFCGILLFCCLCLVYAEQNDEYAENSINNKDYSEQNDEKKFHEICHRIGNLNMTVVTPGSGIGQRSALHMKYLVEKYGINIPDSAITNKDIFTGTDTDDHRLNYFIDAVNSDRKIIWTMRGGYGTARLVAPLNRLPKPNTSKTFIGFCDATALNLFISQNWHNWRVIHAPVLIFLTKGSFKNKFDILLDILEGKIDIYDINGIYPLNDKAKAQKSVIGKLTGGNLTIIESGLKTCWEIQTDGKILFVEDIYEKPEHIYRSLYHLKEAGKLSNIKALIFGDFHKAGDQEKVKLYLKGFSQTLNIPVYITDQFGHGDHNMPLIYNATAKIHDNKMTITSMPHTSTSIRAY